MTPEAEGAILGEGAERPRKREERRFRALLRNDERRHRFLFVSGLVTIGAIGAMAYATYMLQQLPFDLRATAGLQRLGGPTYELMRAVSWVGYSPQNTVIVLLTATGVLLRLGWRDAAYLMALIGAQGLSNHLIKTAIGRPRPTESLVQVFLPNHGFSFPSGHVMFYTVFFGFLFFLIWTRMPRSLAQRLLLALCGAMVLLVGPSRIYLGAHWLSDVIAAHLIALIILLFGIELYVHYIQPPRPTTATTPEEST